MHIFRGGRRFTHPPKAVDRIASRAPLDARAASV
jgi:hypothetical protein